MTNPKSSKKNKPGKKAASEKPGSAVPPSSSALIICRNKYVCRVVLNKPYPPLLLLPKSTVPTSLSISEPPPP